MTSMFALFLVLWIISSTSASQKEAIAQYFQHPTVFQSGSSSPMNMGGATLDKKKGEGMESDQKTYETKKMKSVDSALAADSLLRKLGNQFKTRMTEQGLEIQVSDAQGLGTFELGSARINPQMVEPLQHMAKVLAELNNRMVISGHTDRYAYSGKGYSNWQLSSDRANAVRDAFTSTGIPSERFNAVIGYGDTELSKPDDPYAPENRRVTILVLKQDATTIPATAQEGKPSEKDEWHPLGETVKKH